MHMFSKKSAFSLILSLVFLLTVTACSGIKTSEPYTNPLNDKAARDRQTESVFGSDGLSFGGKSKKDNADGSSGIGVNAFLWRATLDTVSFMPLASADPFGGVVITDWYTPPSDDASAPQERFKLTVYILSKELRADGLKVSAFKQVMDKNGAWTDAKLDADTATKIENAILARARELRVAS